jgi:hypothetical protein
VRFLELSFFREWLLSEAQVNLGSDRRGLVCLLYGPSGMMLLERKSPPLDAILKRSLCRLEAFDTGPAYLRFFCSVARGDNGRFEIIEPGSPLAFKAGISDAERESFVKVVEPLKIESAGDLSLAAIALCLYDGDLYRCKFEIHQDGKVAMLEDEVLSKGVPLRREEFVGPFRLWQQSESCSR